MTVALIIGLSILIPAIAAGIFIIRSRRLAADDRLGAILLVCLLVTVSGALIRVGELPGERRERAKQCIEGGYSLDLNGHEIFGDNADLDLFTVTKIDDENRIVYIITNTDSPEWAEAYND